MTCCCCMSLKWLPSSHHHIVISRNILPEVSDGQPACVRRQIQDGKLEVYLEWSDQLLQMVNYNRWLIIIITESILRIPHSTRIQSIASIFKAAAGHVCLSLWNAFNWIADKFKRWLISSRMWHSINTDSQTHAKGWEYNTERDLSYFAQLIPLPLPRSAL